MSVDFLDTNVFIYLFDDVDARKQEIAHNLVTSGLASGTSIISFQVAQEALNVLTKRLEMRADDARSFLDAILDPMWSVAPSAALYTRALGIAARYHYSFYDSLIVAAAMSAGANRLLSEDLQDGHKIGEMVIVNPFNPGH